MAEVSFGEWLKRRRSAIGLTQEQLARQINCSASALRKFEAELRRPSADVLERLAEIFNIPQEERKSFLRFARGDWQAISEGEPEDAPWQASRVHKAPRSHLPASTTSFIGREKDQEEIKNLITKNRLVTLIGVGGIGKTRLSIEVGFVLLDNFPKGIWLVELAPLSDPALIPPTIVNALGLVEEANRSPQTVLIDFLKDKQVLLILDNCEHLIQACAQLTDTLLHSCPDLHILATSREALDIGGETLYRVPVLTTPDPIHFTLETLSQFEAVQLFLERAQSGLPAFLLTQSNAQAVAQVCHHLDGIPLALELAAARVKGLSVEQIAWRLDDRFRLLTSGNRSALPRHQTLQALIDWSHDLLTEPERILLRRLSVFAGGWTLEAAEAVCADDGLASDQILDLLLRLVDKSLVVAETQKDESRYHMLETIRQYAHEKLWQADEGELMRQRHLSYFVDLAERAEPNLRASGMIKWLDRLEAELDNIRVALEWAQENNIEIELRLASILLWFWWIRNYRLEGSGWLERALSIEAMKRGSKPLLLARAMLRAQACYAAGFLAVWHSPTTEKEHATSLLEESLALFRKLGPAGRRGMAYAMRCLGSVVLSGTDSGRAKSLIEDSLALFREMGDKFGIAECIAALGGIVLEEGNIPQARALIEEHVALSKELGDIDGIAVSLGYLASLAAQQGDYLRAISLRRESLALFRELGNKYAIAYQLQRFASMARAQSHVHRAVRLLGAADALRGSINLPIPVAERVEYDDEVTALQGQIEKEAFAALWEEGKKMSLDEAIAFALEDSEANVG